MVFLFIVKNLIGYVFQLQTISAVSERTVFSGNGCLTIFSHKYMAIFSHDLLHKQKKRPESLFFLF